LFKRIVDEKAPTRIISVGDFELLNFEKNQKELDAEIDRSFEKLESDDLLKAVCEDNKEIIFKVVEHDSLYIEDNNLKLSKEEIELSKLEYDRRNENESIFKQDQNVQNVQKIQNLKFSNYQNTEIQPKPYISNMDKLNQILKNSFNLQNQTLIRNQINSLNIQNQTNSSNIQKPTNILPQDSFSSLKNTPDFKNFVNNGLSNPNNISFHRLPSFKSTFPNNSRIITNNPFNVTESLPNSITLSEKDMIELDNQKSIIKEQKTKNLTNIDFDKVKSSIEKGN
jgi:hypothetical protein